MGISLIASALALIVSPQGTSYYTARLDDAKAVYVTAQADGVADDTAALQIAIDQVQETTNEGIVFLPSGRYRITDTLRIWPGIRMIGYGKERPTLILAPHTPGYQDSEKYMVFFAGWRPKEGKLDLDHPEVNGSDRNYEGDASPGTFYSAMSNIDLEIGEGNASAVGIRGTYAQHCYLAHMDFRLGDAMAGIHDTGNLAEDLRFFGGKYGIITRTPSPGWQYTLMDSIFEGQASAAIRTREAGLTLIRPTFRRVPTAIEVEPDQTEQLWMSDGVMEDISGPAVLISRPDNLRTQINIENIACRNVPIFASFREGGARFECQKPIFVVKTFARGLQFDGIHAEPEISTIFDPEPRQEMPAPAVTDIAKLPPQETWVNLATLGAKGDGIADDTAVLQDAIEHHKTIYLPSGHYRVSETIKLKSDTILIGLHPFTTQILIKDATPGFNGIGEHSAPNPGGYRPTIVPFPGEPKALLETPSGGTNVVSGIGLDTGGNNVSAVAARWMAGKDSMMEDVKFLGGHGSVPWQKIYNQNHSADPDPQRHWNSQYPSLWVTDGGGGTFKNIWTASTFANAGMAITNTTTEGRVYELSSEHHVSNEIKIHSSANWKIFALQTEEEWGEGPQAQPLEIENSKDILVANLNIYRVVGMLQPFLSAVTVAGSSNIRFRNIHCNSNSKVSFDNLLLDSTSGLQIREREFASLDVTSDSKSPIAATFPPTMADNAKIEKLAGGFSNISGGAVDQNGDCYFIDSKAHRIYRWSASGSKVELVQDSHLYPTNLVLDKAGNLVVVSYAGKGSVYAIKRTGEWIGQLKGEPTKDRPGMTAVLPVGDWEVERDVVAGKRTTRPIQFISPDNSTFIPVQQGFMDGDLSWGVKLEDVLRGFGLAKAVPGKPFYVSGENDARTFVTNVEADGSLSNGKLFAEQGGEGLAVDNQGNVYLAAGQIYVYDPAGKKIGTIQVPERPIQLLFSEDGNTLFILARSSLYSIAMR